MQTYRAARSQRNNVALTRFAPVNELLFYTVMEEMCGDITQPLSKAVLKEGGEPERVVLQTQSKHVKFPTELIVNDCRVKDHLPKTSSIDENTKPAVKQLVMGDFTKLTEKTLDDILSTLYHKAQSDIR